MDRNHSDSKVKPILAYLKESAKFYELDKPMPARIIFLLELAVLFGGYLFARPYTLDVFKYFEQLTNQLQGQLSLGSLNMSILNSDVYKNMINALFAVLLIYVVIRSLSFIIALFFGAHYFFGLTNPEMSGGARASLFLSRLPKIIIFNILFYIAFYIAVFLLVIIIGIIIMIIPMLQFVTFLVPLAVMALSTLFIFKDLLIIEFDIGVFKNFKKSLELTRSSRKNIIINMMWPFAIGWLLNAFAIDVNNAALSIFISAFLEVIIILIGQRLSVLMFIDAASIERKDKKVRSINTII